LSVRPDLVFCSRFLRGLPHRKLPERRDSGVYCILLKFFCRELLGGSWGFEFVRVHLLPSGDLLGGWPGYEFFHLLFLPSRGLLCGWFFYVHLPSGELLGFEFLLVHRVYIGDLLGGCRGFGFFHVHELHS